jgi:ACS family tartrate transporter-like MFS transporter
MRTLGIIPAPGDKNPLDSARIKAYLRLIPVLFVCYIIAYVDRTNVGIAKLTMEEDIPSFDNSVFGWGAGVFFLGYFLLEVPGSVIVERWSARKWICRIMVTWGIMAALTAFVAVPLGISQWIVDLWNAWRVGFVAQANPGEQLSGLATFWNSFFTGELTVTAFQFYAVRFLLGVAEAGFFPGVLVYLTHWFPARDRARAMSYFLIASPIAMIIGPAVSRLFLDIGRTKLVEDAMVTYPDLLGMKGWQWIYIFWGIPAVLVGIAVLYLLPDKPRHARWLTDKEQAALENEIAMERAQFGSAHHHSLWKGLSNPRVWLLSFVYFGIVTANYGIEFFLPSILKDWYALQPTQVAWLVMIPSLLVIVGQLGIGWSSDYFQERRWHSVLPVAVGAICLAAAAFSPKYLWLTMIFFTIGAAGMKSYMPAFWSLPSYLLTATAAAGSVGLINSVGNLGGHFGPTVIGWVKENIGSYEYGLCFLACTSLISASLIAVMPLRKKT